MLKNNLEELSNTEIRYVRLMVDDCLTRKEIAEKLCRSVDTVSSQMKNIYRKLEITKVTELSKLFYTGSLVSMALIISFNVQLENQYRIRRYRREREIEQFIPTHYTENM